MEQVTGFLETLVYFVVLIGVLVFVHEGGHFMFAKLFKVKVHVFSLGFGPRLWSIVRGETRYQVSAVPIGGYVKMLGEDPTEEITPEDRGRAFSDKPLWQRFFIIIGGPAMNVVFPFVLLFGWGLSVGQVLPAEIGMVVPGSPAAQAGLEVGDTITAIDGEPIHGFDHLAWIVSGRPGEQMEVTVDRDGEKLVKRLAPRPTEVPVVPLVPEETKTVGRIGFAPYYERSMVGVSDPTSPAARAGIRSFDQVSQVEGREIARLVDLERALREAAGGQVELRLRRLLDDAKWPFYPLEEQLGEERTVSLDVPAGFDSLSDLGLESVSGFVAQVTPDGSAAAAGLAKGDKLVGLDGVEMTPEAIYRAIDSNPTVARTLAWVHAGRRLSAPFKPMFREAGKKGDLGLSRDSYDKGFFGLAPSVVAEPIANAHRLHHAGIFSLRQAGGGIEQTLIGLKLLVQGRISARSLGGPLMIGQLAGMAGDAGLESFVWLMALISFSLGFINLMPIPVLDGGHLVFIAIEAVRRRPIPLHVKEKVMLVGVAMLLFLMVFATWNDIERQIIGF